MRSEILDKEIDCQIVHVGLMKSPWSEDHMCDKWAVIMGGESFDYYTGIGHRKHKYPKNSPMRNHKDCLAANFKEPCSKYVIQIIEMDTKVVPPKLDDILCSLVSDSHAADTTFADWCSDFGYEEDSRKALATYEACQQSAIKLRKAGITDLAAAREAFQGY